MNCLKGPALSHESRRIPDKVAMALIATVKKLLPLDVVV
jgi:hypothetical protein